MKRLSVVIASLLLFGFTYEVHAVNFAIFHKIDKNMKFADVVKGKHGDFLSNMEAQGAEVLSLTNIPHAMHNDVITLQTSALHDADGSLGDFGLDCHLGYKDESQGPRAEHYLGGICRIIRQGRGQDIREPVIIMHTPIHDSSKGVEQWVKIAEQKDLGIAFYATIQ